MRRGVEEIEFGRKRPAEPKKPIPVAQLMDLFTEHYIVESRNKSRLPIVDDVYRYNQRLRSPLAVPEVPVLQPGMQRKEPVLVA